LIGFPGRHQRFTGELVARLPVEAFDATFDELLTMLEAISDADYQMIALRALARGTTPAPSPGALLDLMENPPAWAAYLARVGSEVAPAEVAALVRNGQQLKLRVLATLERFWREAYAEEYERTRALMDRSVARGEGKYQDTSFQETFTAVTGRLVPEPIADVLPGITNVNFMPSCYVGPYVAYTQSAENLYLYYNCRSTPASETTVDVASLYPPLKALADETRLQILTLLQGKELYAQEIVEQLDISQPAVSRHLNLLATAGVLRIRREGNARYYSVDGETLRRLASALGALA
jgi:biotin operon repressor